MYIEVPILMLIVWFAARWWYKKDEKEYTQYKHIKRGTTYNLIGVAVTQISAGDLTGNRGEPARLICDGMPLIIYQSVASPDMYFARFPDEFEDTTRFIPVE